MAIDFTTPTGRVRLLIADVDETNLVLTDDMITGYLGMHTGAGQARRAAADALDAIATSEALISKVIRTQDVATDGAKVADVLRRQAAALRTQADDEDDSADDDSGISVLEFSPYPRSSW